MDAATITIGGTPVTLTKSQTLAAIRPQRGREREAQQAATMARGDLLPQSLGGFQLLNMAQSAQPLEQGLDAIRQDPNVELGTHVYHTSNDGVPFVPTGEIYVVFKERSSLTDCERLLDQHSLEVVRTDGPRTLTVRTTPQSPNPVKVAAALQQSRLVEVAEPDLATPGKLSAFVLPSDDLLNRQWHLRNSGTIDGSTLGLKAGADARVIDAWNRASSLGSSTVVVAVIDDGFDLGHPDFANGGKLVAPWDFTRNSSNPSPHFDSSYPYLDDGEWVGDWHGTACAGVAVASANGSGVLGASPAARLMAVRWGVNLSNSQVVAWFNYVRLQGASVVSCSWGAAAHVFPLSTQIKNAISACATQGRNGLGCVVCFAAGNENRDVNDPANHSVNGFAIHPDVIAVAACTSRDQRSSYSNFGKEISICAPSSGAGGRGVLTADVRGTFSRNGVEYEAGYEAGAFTSTFGGTSSATPLVAGIAALVLAVKPDLTAAQVKALLQETARKIGPASSYGTNGHSHQFGYGCVNADAAIAKIIVTQPATVSRRRTKKSPASKRRKARA